MDKDKLTCTTNKNKKVDIIKTATYAVRKSPRNVKKLDYSHITKAGISDGKNESTQDNLTSSSAQYDVDFVSDTPVYDKPINNSNNENEGNDCTQLSDFSNANIESIEGEEINLLASDKESEIADLCDDSVTTQECIKEKSANVELFDVEMENNLLDNHSEWHTDKRININISSSASNKSLCEKNEQLEDDIVITRENAEKSVENESDIVCIDLEEEYASDNKLSPKVLTEAEKLLESEMDKMQDEILGIQTTDEKNDCNEMASEKFENQNDCLIVDINEEDQLIYEGDEEFTFASPKKKVKDLDIIKKAKLHKFHFRRLKEILSMVTAGEQKNEESIMPKPDIPSSDKYITGKLS